MKVSLTWLQSYFADPLPGADALAEALTFHVAEVEEVTPEYLDVKVLPDRAAYMLSHRGIAYELSAILNLPLKEDPLRTPLGELPTTAELSVSIDAERCNRYIGALVRGVKVGPSPDWLREALASVGQRSINNVVDATNYVMLNIGQPLHAFDAGKLSIENGAYGIQVRLAEANEKITTLSGEEYELNTETLLIADASSHAPIGIAGIKGGKLALVDEHTVDLVVESAHFEASGVRRSAQALKLFTDASARFQNNPSAELAGYGMRDVLALITSSAGGEVVGAVDVYPKQETQQTVTVSLNFINERLGGMYDTATVTRIFDSLGFAYTEADGVYTITSPFERRDIRIPEDVVEEIGRIAGYDTLESVQLPTFPTPPDQARFRGIERMKDQLVEQGFTEVSTQSFAKTGDTKLQNPLDATKPYLRTNLEENLAEALTRAKLQAPLVLSPSEKPKLFEVGNVFPKEGEYLELRITEKVEAWGDATSTVDNLTVAKLDDYGKDYTPVAHHLGTYVPFSPYPFALRDIAVWTPEGTTQSVVEDAITSTAGALLARIDLFDTFAKEGRVSYAFRLVFESKEKTLSDADLTPMMEQITQVLNATDGYKVR